MVNVVERCRMLEMLVDDVWPVAVSEVGEGNVRRSTQSEVHRVIQLVALQMLAVVELEVLDVVELEMVDVVELGMLVVCADVVDGVPVVLAEWVMAVVLCGSKAKDTASCGKWKTVQNS